MFISFEKNECESDCITFGDNSKGQVLGFGKFLKFFLLNYWTTICYPFHSFVRWVTIVYSPIRV
jgi:hypothetical protein